jgi:hypothetical protein
LPRVLFTFDTTHHALWAEELARGHGIPHEIVPAPPAANAKCNLALETLPEWREELEGVLAGPPVPHGVFLEPDS